MIEISIVALYLKLASCVGLAHPLLLPTIRFHDVPSVRCALPHHRRCKGVYYPRSRRIELSLLWPGTISHELMHDILQQDNRPDPNHIQPEWKECL